MSDVQPSAYIKLVAILGLSALTVYAELRAAYRFSTADIKFEFLRTG